MAKLANLPSRWFHTLFGQSPGKKMYIHILIQDQSVCILIRAAIFIVKMDHYNVLIM